MPRLVTRKRVFWVFGVVIGVILVTLVAWIVIAGADTVSCILLYGDTNIDDFTHYPGRELHASDRPFRFTQSDSEFAIPTTALLPFGSGGDLERILETNDSIAFLILQGNTILYERYFQGHTASSISQVFSMSKSFTSVLIGMAVDDGYITGVDQAITDFVPELAPEGFDEVSIWHLLTMTSGSSYVENGNPIGEHVILNFTTELEDQILTFTMEREPGELFRYKSGDNALLGLALDRALGAETITDYTQRRLWTPLGMEDGGIWSVDHEGDGLERTWCCLAASARDIAKLGRLYLDEGTWNGQQLLSADWIVQSTQIGQVPEDAWPDDYRSVGWWNYGYQWWLASQEEGDFFALGKDGQFLYVNPHADLIIVRLGWSNGGLSSSEWIQMLQAIAVQIP